MEPALKQRVVGAAVLVALAVIFLGMVIRDYLKAEYLPAAREGAGLMYMAGGNKLYQMQIESTTTLPLTADEIHQLGLSEVARITTGMETVRREVGFKGTLQQFFEHIRTDPKFKPKSREWLTEEYYRIGKAVDAKGGKNSFYQVDYASRTASELGADIVKLNFPDPRATEGVPKGYAAEIGEQDAVNAVVRSAARTPVLLSGGEKGGDEEVLDKARMAMEAGALGVIFGRNVWQRRHEESLRFIERLKELLAKYPS